MENTCDPQIIRSYLLGKYQVPDLKILICAHVIVSMYLIAIHNSSVCALLVGQIKKYYHVNKELERFRCSVFQCSNIPINI